MTAQELKQYNESITVKELIEILENEETANLTLAKERQSNVERWTAEAIEQKYYKNNSSEDETIYYEILDANEKIIHINSIEFKSYGNIELREEHCFYLSIILHDINVGKTMIPITKEEYDATYESVQALINSHIKNNEN